MMMEAKNVGDKIECFLFIHSTKLCMGHSVPEAVPDAGDTVV